MLFNLLYTFGWFQWHKVVVSAQSYNWFSGEVCLPSHSVMLEENLLFQESVCLFVWQFYLWFPQDSALTLCCILKVMFSQMPLVLAVWTPILEMTGPNKMDRTFISNLLLYLQKITSLFKHPRVLSSVSTLWNVLPPSFKTSGCSKSPLNIFLLYKIVANYFNSLQFPPSWNALTFIFGIIFGNYTDSIICSSPNYSFYAPFFLISPGRSHLLKAEAKLLLFCMSHRFYWNPSYY